MRDRVDGVQRMWAERYRGLLLHIGDQLYAEMYAGSDGVVVEVNVVEVADDDASGTHWAWLPSEGDAPQLAQPHRGMLEMCFHYGTEIEEKHGKGRVVRLAVSEAPVHETWCCKSPESDCSKNGGCSSACNCDAEA